MFEFILAFGSSILVWLFIDYSFCQSQMRISLIETAKAFRMWLMWSRVGLFMYEDGGYALYKFEKWIKTHFGRKSNVV